MEPASIRYKNPGAMWGSPLAIKWGAQQKAVVLNDGKGQGNNIAVFPTFLAGICAQLDLWRSSSRYRGRTFRQAITTWSGGNNVPSYIAFVKARVPGIKESTVMDDAFWQGPMGIPFLKAQAWHEAGKQYPALESDWVEARRRVFGGVLPKPAAATPTAHSATAATAVIATAAVTTGAHQGWSAATWLTLAAIFAVACAAGYALYRHFKRDQSGLVPIGKPDAVSAAAVNDGIRKEMAAHAARKDARAARSAAKRNSPAKKRKTPAKRKAA